MTPVSEHRIDSCYWAVIEPERAGLREIPRRPSHAVRRTLGYLAEAQVPVPIEALHAAFAPIGDGRVAVCLANRATVRAAQEAGADSLKPSACPEGIGVDPDAFELLQSPFEPKARAFRRRARFTVALLGAAAIAGAGAVGLLRRSEALRDAAIETRQSAVAAAEDAIAGAGNPRLPTESRLTQLLRRLRSTHAPEQDPSAAPADASVQLAEVLSRWPIGTTAQAEQVAVQPDRVSFTVSLLEPADASVLVSAYSKDSAWVVGSQNLESQRTRNGERYRLRFTVARGSDGGAP